MGAPRLLPVPREGESAGHFGRGGAILSDGGQIELCEMRGRKFPPRSPVKERPTVRPSWVRQKKAPPAAKPCHAFQEVLENIGNREDHLMVYIR